MNKYSKAFIVCAVVAFIGTMVYAVATMEGVSYSPGISSHEMETMSYSEVTKLMLERKSETTSIDLISNSMRSPWFWKNVLKFWVLLLTVSFVSFLVIDKWCKNEKSI